MIKIPKSVEFHDDKFFVIYKNISNFDILSLNGGLISRLNIGEILLEENLKLVKLTHLKIPVLNWSNR